MPTADVSARPAVPGDEEAIAAIQLAAWAETLGADAVAGLPRDQILATWGAAIEAPPSREHRVFVATDGPHVVGFAALAVNDIVALEVAPEHRRRGHGSRLLSACVDTMRLFGATEVRAWALEGDADREAFLTTAGLGEGGVRRGIDGPDQELHERLWRAQLT
ncbi:GNAT family N-acetyltransferase [Demequina sp. B12]|uniref:GNAT family N-acetyltransferase n=1 Tax=Demequina sp. B12 TaxID=2992757 RepID=UPI00237BF37B|nr:GNAT family N-acetyltransferase [Demequina sp. B12]MDE0573373.1 GNAT family N-acetyltransferase [Demequina sp. B12]